MKNKLIFISSALFLILYLLIVFYNYFLIPKPAFKQMYYTSLAKRASHCDSSYGVFKSVDGFWRFVLDNGSEDIKKQKELLYSKSDIIFLNSCFTVNAQKIVDPDIEYFRCNGFKYAEGIGVRKSPMEAKRYFDLAARRGDGWSLEKSDWIQALQILQGQRNANFIPHSFHPKLICARSSSINLIRLIAEVARYNSHLSIAQYCDARYLDLRTPKDQCDKARILYESADRYPNYLEIQRIWSGSNMLSKYNAASTNLGLLYENGLGAERDIIRAKSLYEKAANDDNPAGMRNLAQLLENVGGAESEAHVRALYSKAAYLGDYYSMLKLRYTDPDTVSNVMSKHKIYQ